MDCVAIERIKSSCCGCMSCVKICPVNALNVSESKGFRFPVVNPDVCIECGLCSKCCPVINAGDLKTSNSPQKVILAKNKKLDQRRRSTSGGVFYPLADFVLSGGGTCYGASFDSNWRVVHFRAENIKECLKFQGSKYVQSDISRCYMEIYNKLRRNDLVLFTGTPCQVAAVRNFCMAKNVNTDKLLTVEILCYGVPSPILWHDYVTKLQSKYGRLLNYRFRDERDGWSTSYNHSALFEDGRELYKTAELQAFGSLFSSHVNIRESCFECRFASMNRCADITIGDCWGIEHIDSEFSDSYGVSQVLLNTNKGHEVWMKVADRFITTNASISAVTKYNSVLLHPAEKPIDYNIFWQDYMRYDFDKLMKKYTKMGKTFKIRRKIKRGLEKILRCITRNRSITP